MGPVLLDAEGHGVRQEFFEGVGRHALDAVAIDAGHEFLEAETLDASARAADGFGGQAAAKEEDDEGGE